MKSSLSLLTGRFKDPSSFRKPKAFNRNSPSVSRNLSQSPQIDVSIDQSGGSTDSQIEAYSRSRESASQTGFSPNEWSPGSPGYEVPYKFRINTKRGIPDKEDLTDAVTHSDLTYTSFVGNRFPSLETGGNYRYWKERGLERLLPKVFPIHLPTHRRIHPLMRNYMSFLYKLDPARFTVRKIAERYGVKERSVSKIIGELSTRNFLSDSGLSEKDRQITKEFAVLDAKEKQYAKAVGYELVGNQDIDEERELGEDFDGYTSTSDFVRLQSIEVESFSAFPLARKRNPVPKRVDVDLPVKHTKTSKIVNWIDPTEKVVF